LIPAYWYSPVVVVGWQIILHSLVAGGALYAWSRHLRLPSGRTKRRILCTLLILPLITALAPGRNSFSFREQTAWLDSLRVLAIPLFDGVCVYHLALGTVALSILVSLWQEVLPLMWRRRTCNRVPERVLQWARELPDWHHCRVRTTDDEEIFLATVGWPSRPQLLVSAGALQRLTDEELRAVLRHENAHWRGGRWLVTHALFVIRMLQCHNPIALWTFREYSIEVEIDCDADAVAGRDPRFLARALLKVYESTDPRDYSTRSTLRRRMNILLGKTDHEDRALPLETLVFVALVLVGLLPWIV